MSHSGRFTKKLSALNEQDRVVVGECLKASAEGPFFPDWEYHLLFDLEREDVQKVAEAWPNVDGSDSDVIAAISGAILNLVSYPHKHPQEWPRYISVEKTEVSRILDQLLGQTQLV